MLGTFMGRAFSPAFMAHRNKNLLEAFSASAAGEKAATGAPDNGASSRVGGPFATAPVQESILTPAERELVKDATSGPPAFAGDLMRPENFPGLVAAVVILVAVSFLIGRATAGGAGPVEASGAQPAMAVQPEAATAGAEQPPVLTANPIPLPGSNAGVRQRTSAEGDRAESEEAARINDVHAQLKDQTNRYTVKLVEYEQPRDEVLATATFYYLIDQGLPAAMVYRGKRLFIVLGAAEQQVGLDSLLKRAKTMDGPPPRHKPTEFFDAYVEKIDNLLERE